jgi:hypothetical protein
MLGLNLMITIEREKPDDGLAPVLENFFAAKIESFLVIYTFI